MLSRYICFLISVFYISCIKDTNNIVSVVRCMQKIIRRRFLIPLSVRLEVYPCG